ncbi:acyl carrier protein [Paludisphaera rhizosphaerae]|uniref:acyl carrier protein n=1 Tax=Paludisphaera rhizosphaerae TaxID=2711216 RepID=UPI00197EB053|nr:acyl carrier protein [Paludisphaera rhizosphaerae]
MNRRTLILTLAVLAGCSERVNPIAPAEPGSAVASDPSDPVQISIRDLIVERLAVDRSKVDMNRPIGDPPLSADDLDLVELILDIEERFDVSIPDEELEKVTGAPAAELPSRITPAHLATLAKQAMERAGKKAE